MKKNQFRNYKFLSSYPFRHAFSAGVAILIACIANQIYSFSHEPWMVLAAFFASQTTRGTPLRQALIYLVIIIAAMLVSIFVASFNDAILSNGILGVIYLATGMVVYIRRPPVNVTLFTTLLFFIVFIISSFMPIYTESLIQNRVFDIVIGVLIGIFCASMVLPIRLGKEFGEGILPILRSLSDYMSTLSEVLQCKQDVLMLADKKVAIENSLQVQPGMYPEWVYEVGFNRGLRAGFRFFLVNIERTADVILSMGFIASRKVDEAVLKELSNVIAPAMRHNQELLAILIDYFQDKKTPSSHADFTSDIADLENALQQIIPANLEILDVSPNYLLLTALVRDMRDVRGLLLQLVMALPADNK